jgi:hypothetical protein
MSGQLGNKGNKRSRHCVSPPSVSLEDDNQHTTDASKSAERNPPANVVWQQWALNFRVSRRLKNDLILDESVDSAVERHMSLTKKRSLLDDDSDSGDEGNYYKLDATPLRRHPSEFTPCGYLGPLHVTPVSSDPDALPICMLRRHGQHEEEESEDQIPPPPPSFLRYPSKKRAVGVARPEPEPDLRSLKTACLVPPKFTRGVSSVEGMKVEAGDAEPLVSASLPPLPTWAVPSLP